MTKSDLISAVAEKTGFTKKDSEAAITATIDAITENLAKGEKIQIVGFGTFEVRQRAAREGINPQNGEKISIKATKAPAFKPGRSLKEAVAK